MVKIGTYADSTLIAKPVTKRLTTPIVEISDPIKSKLLKLCFKYGVLVNTKTSFLDFLKQVTLVIKTRKSCGYLILWHSNTQHPHILTEDCKLGCEFEIKTDKSRGLATLPPSTHRDDQTRQFRYAYECARTDRIAFVPEVYEISTELLEEQLRPTESKVDETSQKNATKQTDASNKSTSSASNGTFYDLSEQMIQTTVAYFIRYYINGHRNDFALHFSGATSYAKISKDSAGKILSQIAKNTNDEEIQNRLVTLHATYENGSKGEEITGGPKLAELISTIDSCPLDEARKIVASIQTMWRDDIKRQQQKKKREQQMVRESKVMSVSEAIRLSEEGPVIVAGKIAGITPVEQMITKIELQCLKCSAVPTSPLDYTKRPRWRIFKSDLNKCYFCECEERAIAVASSEYIPSIQIKLQDLEKIDNTIGQLTAILFDQHTEGFQFNDIVNLKGHLYIMRNYDNDRNKLEGILFVEFVEKQTQDEEVVNKEEDIQQFKQFALEHINANNSSIIDELVSRAAPFTIGNELAKKALLIIAINSGLPNIETRLPERIRSHAGLIGDPGQAKTKLLKQYAKLVAGSRVESVQSGTPISMTVYVDKEENGQRVIRPGPLIFASGAILGLNEFGQMKNIEDGKYFTDAAEEGYLTVTKHGLNFPIIAHPSFIWTANPISGRWKNPQIIDEAEFPIIAQWGDRTDFIIPFIENTDPNWIKRYINQRKELVTKLGSFDSITLWMKKYLMYGRSLNPELPDDMRAMLGDYLIEIVTKGVRGWPRKLEALERTAIGFAKLKLKEVVDEEDVSDTMELFNEMLKFYNRNVVSGRDTTFLQCLAVLQKTKNSTPWVGDTLIAEVCSKNPQTDLYIGKLKTSRSNWKIKAIKSLLDKHPNVQRAGDKPVTYYWVDQDDKMHSTEKNKDGARIWKDSIEQSVGVLDACDAQNSDLVENKNSKIKFEKTTSHTSHTSTDSSITIDTTTTNDQVQDAMTMKISQLLKDGHSQKDTAVMLGISQGRVVRTMKYLEKYAPVTSPTQNTTTATDTSVTNQCSSPANGNGKHIPTDTTETGQNNDHQSMTSDTKAPEDTSREIEEGRARRMSLIHSPQACVTTNDNYEDNEEEIEEGASAAA
jgi:DNA replicative helicase MCM subunit Mcm2 (Cdc46/Mcm family)